MANLVEIEVRTVDKTQFPKIENQARASGNKIADTMGRVGDVAGGVLVAGIVSKLTAFAARGIDFILGGIDLASSFNESLSKVNTIFGESADEIEAWAGTAADKLGLAEGAALDAAGSFGNMFDQLGFGADVTADMSTSMVQLAADMASFHNADITEVIDAQSAAFRGEYDSLQRFIPTANAAAIEQEALAQTGKAAASELTAQEKALAAYTFMLQNAGAASGDFARTADSQANAQRRASAAMTNMQTELGQRLLPVMALVTQAQLKLADAGERYLIPALDRVGQFISDHESQFRALGEVLTDVANVIGDHLSGMLERLDISGVEGLAIALGVLLAGAVTLLGVAAAGAAASLVPLMIVMHAIVTVIASVRKGMSMAGDAIDAIRDKVPGAATAFGVLADVLGFVADGAERLFGAVREGMSDSNAWVDAVNEAIAGISVDPDTLSQLTSFADTAMLEIEVGAASAAAEVDRLEAELEDLLAQIQEMAGAYDTTAVFRRIEEEAARLSEQAKELEGDVYSVQFGFDRTSESGRNLETGFEALHGQVLTLAEQFVNGDITAQQFSAGQARVAELIRQVAADMGATQEETDALVAKYATVPDDVITRVSIVDQASVLLGSIASKIERIPGHRSMTVSVIDQATAALNNIAGAIGRVPRSKSITLQTRASGGAASGMTLVGEDGPELVDLPPGSYVHSGPASGALGQGGGGSTVINQLYFAGSLYAERDLEAIVANLQRRGGTR